MNTTDINLFADLQRICGWSKELETVKLIDVDVDVDGCGTNVETMIQVEGKHELTKEIFNGIKDTIQKYKKECDGEYDTDSIVETVCEYLENEGYMCDYISEDVAIEF